MLFTRHAPDKLAWPAILTNITRNMAELERLRKLLITKRERFKFKLESVSEYWWYCCHILEMKIFADDVLQQQSYE
jgi:hypothetical protein